jgi:son of sevenless-like protein
MDICIADRLYTEGQRAVTYLSAFISLLSGVHVARHVDIDGISQGTEQSPTNELYAQTVDKARLLVRTLEVAVQSLYDDCSALLLAIQSFKPSEVNHQSQDEEYLHSLTSALKANLKVVQQTLEELLSVGHAQADMAQGDYNGSIEWRMSRLSMIDNQFGGTLRPTSGPTHQPYHLDGEDVIDIEHAFRPPESKTQDNMGTLPAPPALDPTLSGPGDVTAHPQNISFPDRALTAQVQSDAPSDINRDSNASPLFDDDGAAVLARVWDVD